MLRKRFIMQPFKILCVCSSVCAHQCFPCTGSQLQGVEN